MIRISRAFPAPTKLSSDEVERAKASVLAIARSGNPPKSDDFERHWGHGTVRLALWEMQQRKCCYCERIRDVNRESDVEHFRPKADIFEESGAGGYWWLAYEWTNLFFSCRYCNQEYKKTQFPLQDPSRRARTQTDSLDAETPILIDPTAEDPADFIGYDWQSAYGVMVFPCGFDGEGRGAGTIRITGLDRSELNEDRASFVGTLQGIVVSYHAARALEKPLLLNDARDDIRRETSSSLQYTGFRRAFFRAAGLGEYVSDD